MRVCVCVLCVVVFVVLPEYTHLPIVVWLCSLIVVYLRGLIFSPF